MGSDRNFAAQHPQGATKAWRIWALTPKMPDPASASASELISPTPCGRAEQRRLGRIKILDVRRPRSGLVSKISAPDEQRKESRSDPDFGSPFFGLPYFGEAKKGESPAAATERHQDSAKNPGTDATQRFDRRSPNGDGSGGGNATGIRKRTSRKVKAQIPQACGPPCGCCASLRSEIAIRPQNYKTPKPQAAQTITPPQPPHSPPPAHQPGSTRSEPDA